MKIVLNWNYQEVGIVMVLCYYNIAAKIVKVDQKCKLFLIRERTFSFSAKKIARIHDKNTLSQIIHNLKLHFIM